MSLWTVRQSVHSALAFGQCVSLWIVRQSVDCELAFHIVCQPMYSVLACYVAGTGIVYSRRLKEQVSDTKCFKFKLLPFNLLTELHFHLFMGSVIFSTGTIPSSLLLQCHASTGNCVQSLGGTSKVAGRHSICMERQLAFRLLGVDNTRLNYFLLESTKLMFAFHGCLGTLGMFQHGMQCIVYCTGLHALNNFFCKGKTARWKQFLESTWSLTK